MQYVVNSIKTKSKNTKRAHCAVTLEVLPKLLGLNENVMLQAITVDHSRNIAYFYLAGDGLEEYEPEPGKFKAVEGQEAHSFVPPAWDF